MIEEKGKKYFKSDWSACDCHLVGPMYNAMIRLSSEERGGAIGVAYRDYRTGLVKVAVSYNDGITDEKIKRLEDRLEIITKEEFVKAGFHLTMTDDFYRTKIVRHRELRDHGYTEKDIKYCFWCENIFRKEAG